MKTLVFCENAGNILSWSLFPPELRGSRVLSGHEHTKEANLGVEVSRLAVGETPEFTEVKH